MRVSTSFSLGLPGRWIVSAVALGYVAWTLDGHGVLRGPWPPMDARWLAVAAAGLPLNLGLEVAKWVRLTHFRPGPAVRHVLVGAAAGFLTPNRIGDGFGRAAAVPAEDRERALRAWTTSAGSQALVTLAAGAGALLATDRLGWALLATLAAFVGTRMFLSWSPLVTPWTSAEPVPPPPAPAPVAQWVLVWPGGVVPIRDTALVIGRSKDCDVPLADGNVSRRHAEIGRSADGFVLRDLDSTNGTTVNGRRVKSAPVGEGDEITLGTSTLRIEQRPG